MKHIWSIVCKSSSIDFESNLLSIFDCVEEIGMSIDKESISGNKKLLIPVEFDIISLWSVEDVSNGERENIRWEVVSPSGQVLSELRREIKSSKNSKRLRNRIAVSGLPVTESGRYYMRLSILGGEKYKTLSEIPIEINIEYR